MFLDAEFDVDVVDDCGCGATVVAARSADGQDWPMLSKGQ